MASTEAGEPLLQDYDSASLDFSAKDEAFVSIEALRYQDDDFEAPGSKQSRSVWQRWLMAVRRRNVRTKEDAYESTKLPVDEENSRSVWRWRCRRLGLKAVLLFILFFGIIRLTDGFVGLVHLLTEGPLPPSDWLPLAQYQVGNFTGLTTGVKPIHCHSHNDYWRRVPLFEALRWGCTGVEADVWLFDDDLYVGHSTNALSPTQTLRSMYIDPLLSILDHQNRPSFPASLLPTSPKAGVFEQDPSQTLVLLIDFKNDGRAILPVVKQHLEPLRRKNYLSSVEHGRTIIRAITVVATGNAPFDDLTDDPAYRDIFFDAPLDRLSADPAAATGPKRAGQGTVGTDASSHFDASNSYYASVDFKQAVGWAWFGRLSSAQREAIRSQIQAAKARGLKARYWGAPKWPVGLRDRVWEVLMEEDVDYLNGDDLRAMTALNWEKERNTE